ncbi:hypothetical protein PHYSODRAFT_347785 [Phytophthora sojae]|uniref:RxLR effector protein n=1 Tax=Phytophthora sojae (strain P6497) TaxID=1094619 RepID=G5A535_PHYSP|nr:hypothetical protein PHYSODRAFT_347785 [Phytophthora sojae]EGZ09784.1 hypothetical protein PHYSODRAFT_347785 [Phytophthora sojae]|eukprot:XP_009534645.1 hypothetical protein PHYSODRAFT_347785 [Phytophthora sojae]
MRLIHVVLVAVAALVAGSDAARDSADISKADGATTKRSLRTEDAASKHVETAERRLVNIDLILQDAMSSVKKAVKWKLQFAVWKAMRKTPVTLAQELGIMNRGHAKWEKLKAYQKYYGRGPLKYP